MHFGRRILAPGLALTAVLSVVAAVPVAYASSHSKICLPKQAQPVDPSQAGGFLYGVSAVSSCSAWAVGTRTTGSGGMRTLIEHWNGHAWNIAVSPNRHALDDSLAGVAASSPVKVWAVGAYGSIAGVKTLIVRWNGTAWRAVTSPSPGISSFLTGVAAAPSGNAWAVGLAETSTSTQTLTEHWNGRAWRRITSPTPSPSPRTTDSILNAVTIISPTNVWAVGSTSGGGFGRSLIEHWNGHSWRQVAAAKLAGNNELFSVSAVSASNVWAVGDLEQSPTRDLTLIEHWNGHAWHVSTSPSPGSSENTLAGVDAISRTSVWAVGYTSNGIRQTLIEHWNGHAWHLVASQNPGGPSNFNYLAGVSGTSCANLWAVGHFAVSATGTPTAERC